LNDDYNNFSGKIKHVHFRARNWKIFPKPFAYKYVHFGAASLIHSALQRNAATLRKVLAPFSVSHVIAIDSCSYLGVSLSVFSFLIL